MTAAGGAEVPFQAHIDLLQRFIQERAAISEQLQDLLNTQARSRHDAPLLSREIEDRFYSASVNAPESFSLRGQLQRAHWAEGFRPRVMPGIFNDLIDPGELMRRGVFLWQQTRWPGRNARLAYAQALFTLYLIRCLELLVMRIWDAGPEAAGARLAQVQGVLDALGSSRPAGQPIFVRDARWLIPLAMSPTTDELAPYFKVMARISASLSEADRVQIHAAAVKAAGGHLRSQLRHYLLKQPGTLEDRELILTSRNSNALDFAILVQGLVPLLKAYEALLHGDEAQRLPCADAICQGLSADPELFVNRVDLLGPYSMIEDLFIELTVQGHARYTPMGDRHRQLLVEYSGLIGRLALPLLHDCLRFKPAADRYSPYGVIYGFSSNLTEHMALKTLAPDADTRFSLEDVFAAGDGHDGRLEWVTGWRRLPHIDPSVQRLFDYPQVFAEALFERIERALRLRVAQDEGQASPRSGQLLLAADGDVSDKVLGIGTLPACYVGSSDAALVASGHAHAAQASDLLRDRQEGMFLVTYRTAGGWTGISKDVLTDLLGSGRNARPYALPAPAAAVLRLMAPEFLAQQPDAPPPA